MHKMSLRITATTRFDSSNLYTTSYKQIGTHDIEVNVLVPKGIPSRKHAVIIKCHGDGLVSNPLMTTRSITDMPLRPQVQQYTLTGSPAT
jgi:hypothetical protein